MNVSTESEEKSADKDAVEVPPAVTATPVETPVTSAVSESAPESVDAAEENIATTENSDNDVTEPPPPANEEGSENTDGENTVDETPEIKVCFTEKFEYLSLLSHFYCHKPKKVILKIGELIRF